MNTAQNTETWPPITQRVLLIDKLSVSIPSFKAVINGSSLAEVEVRYLPRLGEHVVTPDDMPTGGYATSREAHLAAYRYREACRNQLQTEGFPVSSHDLPCPAA